MNYKELKKLADVCRKAGIKSYKDSNFEFVLTDEMPPISAYKLKKQLKTTKNNSNESSLVDDVTKEQQLTEEQMLFWSSGSDEQDIADQ